MQEKKYSSTVLCSCHVCGETFYCKGDDIEILPSMKPTKGLMIGDPLFTWADWVIHIQTHCENCRISVPPPNCVQDLHYHANKYKTELKKCESDEITIAHNQEDNNVID